MNDIEARLSSALRTQLDQLEMPNRLPLIEPRARQQRRLRSVAVVAALIVGLVGISLGVGHLLDGDAQQPATPKLEKTLLLPGRPTNIVSAANAIWISTYTDNGSRQFGQVTRIDPASGQVWHYQLGVVIGGMQIVAGPEGVFVLENANKGTIAQLDPRSPTVIRRFSGQNYRQLQVGAGSLWTGNCGGSVTRIDPSTLHTTATIPVIEGTGPPDFKCQNPVLFAHHALWVLTGQHRLSRLDPKTQAITKSVPVPFAYTEGSLQNVAFSPRRIWATYSNLLDGRVRIIGADTSSGRVVVSRRVGRAVSSPNDLTDLQGRINAIAANRHYLWLAGPDRILWLDPSTLRATRTTRVSDPTGLTVVGDSLWVTEGGPGSRGAVQRIAINGGDSHTQTQTQYPAPSFSSNQGWDTKSTGAVSAASFNEPIATAANVPLTNDHNLYGIPRGILASLPPDGVLISAAMLMPDKFPARPGTELPRRSLPLQLSQAQRQSVWETQPAKNVPQFVLVGVVKRQYIDVRVFFGTQHPSASTLQAAQQELDHLHFPDR